MESATRKWTWETATAWCWVEIVDPHTLRWSGGSKLGRWDEGGSVLQPVSVFLRTGTPGYAWMKLPVDVERALVEALGARRLLGGT